MLVPGETKNSSILFINCMAGIAHDLFNAYIVFDIGTWIRAEKLAAVLSCVAGGGAEYQPGNTYQPLVPDQRDAKRDFNDRRDGYPYARLVVEVEHCHRSARAQRKNGFDAMNNPYTRLFLSLKIWKKGKTGGFAAAAVLWGKNDDGSTCVRKAVDFGTEVIPTGSKTGFAVEGNELLPPVREWTRPEPRPGYDSLGSELESYAFLEQVTSLPMSDSWNIALPAADVLFKTSVRQSTVDIPYFLIENPTVNDCFINLQVFLWQIAILKF
jgi:hypothetical protein